MAELPFIRSFIEGGPYVPHASEPPLFSRKEGHYNRIWCDWLDFVLRNGPSKGDEFHHLIHTADDTSLGKIQLIAQKLGEAITADIAADIALPPEPPSLFTTNGRYISHAWVLDIARRDSMPIHEAVALGCSMRPT